MKKNRNSRIFRLKDILDYQGAIKAYETERNRFVHFYNNEISSESSSFDYNTLLEYVKREREVVYSGKLFDLGKKDKLFSSLELLEIAEPIRENISSEDLKKYIKQQWLQYLASFDKRLKRMREGLGKLLKGFTSITLDTRKRIRTIMRFLFKNMDDTHSLAFSTFNNINMNR